MRPYWECKRNFHQSWTENFPKNLPWNGEGSKRKVPPMNHFDGLFT